MAAARRKPGALRNGAPFKDWPLPPGLERVRRKLKDCDDGDRQMVKVLSAVLTDGLATVEAACVEALAGGVHSADVILNILGAAPRSAAGDDDPDPRLASAASLADRRLRPLRPPAESVVMERTDILEASRRSGRLLTPRV